MKHVKTFEGFVNEEVRKTLKEGAGFNSNNPKHQKAAIALSDCIKTKIAPLPYIVTGKQIGRAHV